MEAFVGGMLGALHVIHASKELRTLAMKAQSFAGREKLLVEFQVFQLFKRKSQLARKD